jgi:hypothetical protein
MRICRPDRRGDPVAKQRPEPGVEYAAEPTAEYRAHRSSEAAKSLARWLGTTEIRALDLLGGDPSDLVTEIRSRQAYMATRRNLQRRAR